MSRLFNSLMNLPRAARTACQAVALSGAALLACATQTASAGGISTVQIMSDTITAIPSCLNYSITGMCFFLRCELFYCYITESIRVQHYMPDDVVSTYPSSDQHPWIDIGKLLSTALKSPGDALMGSITDSQADTWQQMPTREQIVLFKSADAIGNPVEAIIGGNMTFGFPDFTELTSFASSGLSQIAQQWGQVPAEELNAAAAGYQSFLSGAKNLVGQLGGLSGSFSGLLSNTGGSFSSLPSSFSNMFSMSKMSDIWNNVGNLDFSSMLGGGLGDLSSIGQSGITALNQLGDIKSLQDLTNQIGSIMGNQVGGASGQDFSSMSGSQVISALGELICPGGSGLFTINFDSDLDNLFWRGEIPLEQLYPGSWIPGISEVGNGLVNTWGSLYPRIGETTQPQPVKASAVVASRVANIIEQAAQPHIYKRLTGQGSYHYFKVAQDPKWQMLYPVESNSCVTFGENDSLGLTSYGDNKTSDNNSYAWNLWHKYECCKNEGAYLFSIP